MGPRSLGITLRLKEGGRRVDGTAQLGLWSWGPHTHRVQMLVLDCGLGRLAVQAA